MMTDPIADMLTRMRNAALAKKKSVVLPCSKIKLKISDILKNENYISSYKVIKNKFDELEIELKYNEDGTGALKHLKRISKPSKRVYADKDNLPVILNNIGIAIISTSQGIMTNKEAKKKKIGGEVICEIY
ncbi:MAG: 30S ribosomal protein S8 [bacterium]